MRNPTRRRFLAWGGAAASTGLLYRSARSQTPQSQPMNIGLVVPAKTGSITVRTSITDYAGEGARMGAIFAESGIGELASDRGWNLRMLHANSPTAQAAERAGQRLVETGNICALVGGVGAGQAEVLSAIAEKAQVPFFNIGSSRHALRQAGCGRYTFHVEASAAMYLDALVTLAASQGRRRWFVFHEDSDDGRALHARALMAFNKHGSGGEAVGAAAVRSDQPIYVNEVSAALGADPDAVLLLVNAVDQLAIMGQMDSMGLDALAVTFPDAIAQTRDYIVSVRAILPKINPRHRVALWETTLRSDGASTINDEFMSRWGQPTDPTAWSAYSATKMLFEAAVATGTLDGSTLVSYFESPGAVFDIGKGPGVSFRPWDHQLRQPLYMIEVDQELQWIRSDIATWVGVARLAAVMPNSDLDGDPFARLDRFGDGPEESACRL